MKQVLQNLSTGATEVEDIPCPAPRPGHLLIRTTRSLVSAGTERMLVEFGKAGLLDKARQQPDKVRMAIDKIRTDGLRPTLDAIRDKLDQPAPMGYCNVGVVIDVGPGVTGYRIGDRVASNGRHAQVVCVPSNLCAKVPDDVVDDAAAFTVMGAIALQGIRLAAPTLGECVVVMGLGLIGLLGVQLLRANGCRVLGMDPQSDRLRVAEGLGATTLDLTSGVDPVAAGMAFSRGRGVDAVLITASTRSNEPIRQAAAMSRKRGRIVLVGITGLELRRSDFYEKELSLQVSCSYGPGRYDADYEERGHDYPPGFVRWTEQRNFEAVLDLLAQRRLDTEALVSHRFAIQAVNEAYRLIERGTQALGILLTYSETAPESTAELRRRAVPLVRHHPRRADGRVVVGVIGAGNYATRVLIPALAKTRATLKTVASQSGVSATHAGKKYGFEQSTTDADAVIHDPCIDAVVVATRHDSHARLVCAALEAGKHVFVEKPLATRREELAAVEAALAEAPRAPSPLLMVGFNRRFAPHVRKVRELLAQTAGPKAFVMTVNAGGLPSTHWTQDPVAGGGRLVGEACHFIDLLRFLAGSPIRSLDAIALGGEAARGHPSDTASISLHFADDSFGVVHYLANGHRSFPKERLEVFCEGAVLQLDNFRTLRGFGWPGFGRMSLWQQDKGNQACVAAFVAAVAEGSTAPIPVHEVIEVARATLDAVERFA